MAQPIVGGQPLAERALAGGGRSVDGDDHASSAPNPRINRHEARKARRDERACRRRPPAFRSRAPSPGTPWRCGDPCGSRPCRRRRRGPCRARSGRRPRSRPRRRWPASPSATAASRSDSLTRSSFNPRIRVVPSANAAATARIGYSSIIDGARSAGTSTPLSADALTRKSAISSPTSLRRLSVSMSAPISRSVVIRPVRSGLVITSVSMISEPGTISAATIGNAADDGSAGTTTGAGASSGSPLSVILRPCAPSGSTVTLAPKCDEQLLGMVAARLRLDHRGLAGRGQRREQHRRFDLRRRNRRAVDDRDRVARARERQRQPATFGHLWWRARRSDRPDRGCAASAAGAATASPSNVAVIGQPATAPITRRQPVAELPKSSTPAGSPEAADPDPVDAPCALPHALDRGAQRAHGLRRC